MSTSVTSVAPRSPSSPWQWAPTSVGRDAPGDDLREQHSERPHVALRRELAVQQRLQRRPLDRHFCVARHRVKIVLKMIQIMFFLVQTPCKNNCPEK